ncbi:MAG: hypothetical protein JW891_08645 [Candidatus Lokiarchaeota archaeon]|nr:hypothetical protein [Candidatus Lokiarchaeota archaeon]
MVTFNDLNPQEIFTGIFAVIFVSISVFIGLLFLKKYFNSKRIEQLSLGLTWVLLSSGWWGSAFSFLSIIISGYAFRTFEFLFLNNAFFILAIIFWIYSFVHIFYQDKEKNILIITTIIFSTLDAIFICLLIIDPTSVGQVNGYFYQDSGIYLSILNYLIPLVSFILGVFFSVMSIKHDEPSIRKRGIILLIAFSSLLIGALGSELFENELILLTIMRIILLSSAIEYYVAFFISH